MEEDIPIYVLNFLKSLKGKYTTFNDADYLFAIVYLTVIESGFMPIEMFSEYDVYSVDFDIRRLSRIDDYPQEQISRISSWDSHSSHAYSIIYSLGHLNCQCELQGVVSRDPKDSYLVLNFVSQSPHKITSTCLDTKKYIGENTVIQNYKDLCVLIKNKLIFKIKTSILLQEGYNHFGHILGVPEEIQRRIVLLLCKNFKDVLHLGATCTHLYELIKSYDKLWKDVYLSEISHAQLNIKVLSRFLSDSFHNYESNYRNKLLYFKSLKDTVS